MADTSDSWQDKAARICCHLRRTKLYLDIRKDLRVNQFIFIHTSVLDFPVCINFVYTVVILKFKLMSTCTSRYTIQLANELKEFGLSY